MFQSMSSGNLLVTVVGVISIACGLWIVNVDIVEMRRIVSGNNGWVFVAPIVFASLDIYSTLINLSISPRTVELNPFVAAAVQYGSAAMIPFMISYFALSQGLALLMLRTGSWLFTESGSARFLPFALVCSVSSFGPFSNLLGMGIGYDTGAAYILATIASAGFCTTVFSLLRNATLLRTTTLK